MDPNSLDPSRRLPQQENLTGASQQAQAVQTDVDTAPNSEIGRIAQDVGSVIGDWQDRLNQVLLDWFNEVNQMENDIDNFKNNAETVVNQLRGMIKAYQQYPDHVDFTDSQNQRMLDMMSLLGVPPSQIEGGGLDSDGYHYYTGSQYAHDIKIAMQYAVQDLQSFSASISSYKQDETKYLFEVMICFNGVKMNEESLTGLMQMLASLESSLMQNIS